MSLIRNRSMTDLAFYRWINGFPTSGYQFDWWRFLGFIITERCHRCKKYNTFEKFESECLAYSVGLRKQDIKKCWEKKQRIEEFLDDIRNAEMPTNQELSDLEKYGHYAQRNIINHKLYLTKLSEEEYIAGGISIAEVRRRLRDNAKP